MDPYILTKLIGFRAKQLESGSEPKTSTTGLRDPLSVATKEYNESKLNNYIVQLPKPGGGVYRTTVGELRFES
jgi:DNA-directed RNA polymerase subunit K/omega